MSSSQEVPFRPSRQSSFTDEQRWLLLVEYDKCLERGAKAAFCRRVGVSAFSMSKWSRWREQGRLVDPATKEPATPTTLGRRVLSYEERRELERLRRENQRLQRDLEQSHAAVELLGKAAALLESLAKSADKSADKSTDQTPTPDPPPGRPEWLMGPDTSKLPPIPSRPSRTSE